IDFNDPLYLHPSDTPGVNLVTEQLIGNENYSVWSRAMMIARKAKNKTGFIDESCKKPDENSPLLQWERCNAIVLSWIMNTVLRELFNGIVYSTDAQYVWKDLKERFDKVNGSQIFSLHKEIAYLEHDQQQKLLQFLMGLNDSYGGIRSQILMNPLPTVGQAYSLISQEESHRGIIAGGNNSTNLPALFYSNKNN
ncbi:LOW QUALITY PROTEIN: UBN2_3 domain-containing protein, partial [Cephalotus follicularis]